MVFFFSQRVLIELTNVGFTREEAYSLVQKHAMHSWNKGTSFFNNLTSKLSLKGKVVFYDKKKDIKIMSEEIIYNRNIEKIISKGNTKIQLADNYNLITKNIEYLKKC